MGIREPPYRIPEMEGIPAVPGSPAVEGSPAVVGSPAVEGSHAGVGLARLGEEPACSFRLFFQLKLKFRICRFLFFVLEILLMLEIIKL